MNYSTSEIGPDYSKKAYQYPLDLVTLSIEANASLNGAEIRIYDMDNIPAGSLGTELSGTESNVGTNYSVNLEAGNSIWIQIMQDGYEEFGQQTIVPSSNGSFYALMTAELNS
jgi:hypothetical protein